MKKLINLVSHKFLLMLCILSANALIGQPISQLSITEAYALLEKNYPSLQNADLLTQIQAKELDRLERDLLPELYVKADGRVQSESTSLETEGLPLPFEIDQPIVSIRSYAEARYKILDGGLNKTQRQLKEVQLKAELQEIEVEKFALRQRINQLFSGIALLREQSKLFELSLKDLQARKEQIEAGLAAGVLLESELMKLEVRMLELTTQQKSLNFQTEGFLRTLAQLIGKELSKDVELKFPQLPDPQIIPELNRPEQTLFQLQRASILANAALIDIQVKPQLAAYAQAGLGYPNPLNILDNNLAPFGVLGLQLNWKITDWKKGDIDRELLNLQAQKLKNAEASFEFNIQSKEAQYLAAINKLYFQIEQDKKIAQLQAKILEQLAAQLDGGVITSADYLTQLNAELSARQNLLVHQTELQKIQLDFWNERGGF